MIQANYPRSARLFRPVMFQVQQQSSLSPGLGFGLKALYFLLL